MHRRSILAALTALISLLVLATTASAATTRTVCAGGGCDFTTIQAAVDGSDPGDTVSVQPGTYVEDVLVNKQLTLQGAGASSTTIIGPIGGDGATVRVATTGVVVDGFTITRAGNAAATWDDAGLNFAGVAVQGQTVAVELRNSRITGNRSGIDINNSNGNSIHNNVIENNHTGMIFRNQTDDTTVTENEITENRTVGILFLDASGGSNAPVQTAADSDFSGNDISANWYGQIVDRQQGGSLPAPGSTNLKNFSANWFGTQAPVVTTANSAEPGYSSLIPEEFGGTATAPGGQPDIAGTASANFDYTPLLRSGTDADPATMGFQGDFSELTVTTAGAQTGMAGRIDEAVDRVSPGGTIHALAGTYAETATLDKAVHLIGAGSTQTVVDPPANGPAISIAASGTEADPLSVESLQTTGAGGAGNTGTGLAITAAVSHVDISHVKSIGNGGHGFAVNTAGAVAGLRLDQVDFSANGADGIRFPTSMDGLDGLTIVDSHFDLNNAGMEIYGPSSTTPVTNVSITNSSFDRNTSKGIYAERLDHAVLDNISVDASGISGGFAAGIDLNLKRQDFSDITIRDSSITDSGTGDDINGVGIAIKARDDGSNGPTTLTGVTLTGNTITGNQLGLRIGEPGKDNAGPTGVAVNRNDISGNVNGAGAVNVSQATADLTCNWWGSADGPSGEGPGSGDSVGAGLDFAPFLVTSDLEGGCRPPVAADDAITTAEDTAATGSAPGVLGNDTDPEGRPLTAVRVSDPAHGTLSLSPNGSYTYTPAANYNGPDSFTYRANNDDLDSNVATVSINVSAVNDAPVAVADQGSVAENGILIVPAAAGVLSNDTDVEGSPLTATLVSNVSRGALQLNPDGSYGYQPQENYSGPDSFTYRASDGSADSNVVTVTLNVNPVVQQGTPGGEGEDITAPDLGSARLTHTVFRVDDNGTAARAVAARRHKKGTKIVYSLSEPARVVFTVQRKLRGRRVHGKCRKRTHRNRGRRHCTRFRKVGRFADDGAAGRNVQPFSGKIGSKTLRRGRYRFKIRAIDAAGNRSSRRRLSFRVARR